MLLERIFISSPAGHFSCSRACYKCSFLISATFISGLKSNFVIRYILHAPPPTSFTASLAVNAVNFTAVKRSLRLSDRLPEHLCFVRNNYVEKSFARHFNIANHSVSDIKICPVHPFLVVMLAVKDRKSVLFLKFEPLIPTGYTNDFRLFHSFCFCPACANKNCDFSPFYSIVYVHPPPTYAHRASFTDRL